MFFVAEVGESVVPKCVYHDHSSILPLCQVPFNIDPHRFSPRSLSRRDHDFGFRVVFQSKLFNSITFLVPPRFVKQPIEIARKYTGKCTLPNTACSNYQNTTPRIGPEPQPDLAKKI